MQIVVRKPFSNLKHVVIKEGSCQIDLGLLDSDKTQALAETLVTALRELGPDRHQDFLAWLNKMAEVV